MHLQSQNYVEAALTLKLHSDLHEWDLNVFVGPMEDLGLPQQSHFHRKETLCLLILNYLGEYASARTGLLFLIPISRPRKSLGNSDRDLQGIGLPACRGHIQLVCPRQLLSQPFR